MSEVNVDARLIGIIGKPHGIKGETVIMLLTDYPKTVKKGDVLFFDEKCIQKAEVENIRWKKTEKPQTLIIKFKGVDSRSDAEDLKGISVYRSIKDGPVLEENQYWIDDIIGCAVYTKGDIFVGKVINVERSTANDNLNVRIENRDLNIECMAGNIFYIPIIENYIDRIDLKNKKIILKKIPEYI
ncbi:MAG TPA: ribosome maturation factor RimM [Candidatus Hydromicrobium sp.]